MKHAFLALASTLTLFFACSANADYYEIISGSAQFLDQADYGIAGSTFYNPVVGGPTSKQYDLSLSGLTYNSQKPWAAHAFASADLARGELKIIASASGAGFASASARMHDDVTLRGNFNSSFNGTPCYAIPCSFTVQGALDPKAFASAGIMIHSGAFGIDMHQKLVNGTTTVFSGIINTTGAIRFEFYINTDGYVSNGAADFSNTARFSWQLPEGVTASSVSGVFMHAPEPAMGALFGLGLLALIKKRK